MLMLILLAVLSGLALVSGVALGTRSHTASCTCLTQHPDDPTPCPSCCTRWERVRFTVENFVMIRVLRRRTCICGEH